MAKVYKGQPGLDYWEATQKVLQGENAILRRPRLTEALLKKPPFRFLHDIITEVCRQTGFAGGLFSPEEQISSNMKDKESKVAYLWKIINCVGITLNAHVPARPLKIVSGMEPEQTNVFLQASGLASSLFSLQRVLQMLAAATTVDSPVRQRAVSRVLLGEKMPTPEQGKMDWAHRYFLLSGCVLPGMKEGGAASTHRNADEAIAASLSGIDSQQTMNPASANENLDIKNKTGKEEVDRKNLQKPRHVGNPAIIASGAVTPTGGSRGADEKLVEEGVVEPLIIMTTTDEAWPPPVQSLSDANMRNCGRSHQQMLDMPPSTAGTEILPAAVRPMTVGGDGRANFNAWTGRLDTLGGFPSFAARPQSARKGPPKIPNSVVAAAKAPPKNVAAAQSDTHSSMMGGIEKVSIRRPPSILFDREFEEEEEEDDDEKEQEQEQEQEQDRSDSLPVLIPAQKHLQAKDLGKSPKAFQGKVEKVDDDSVEEQDILSGVIKATKDDVQTREEEVQVLRVMVQSLCQATNPLGKAMDYLQEDEEAMNKEHQFWIKEWDVYRVRLDEEKRNTDEMLQGEAGRILELEEEFHYYQHKITSAKAQILRNDDTITNLLRMVTTRQLK